MTRRRQLLIRTAEDETALVTKVARRNGQATSTWARTQILRAAKSQLDPPDSGAGPLRTDLELLSLFCGPGGLDEGFRQAGFGTSLAVDIDEECVRTFKLNHPAAVVHRGDLNRLSLTHIDELAGRTLEPIGVVGGPPCQGFSVSNVHQRDDDPRHKLPTTYAKLLGRLNRRHPLSFFVFENVPGLLGKKHIHRYQRFKRDFAKVGFEVHEHLLNAMDYGVPQDRRRIFIVGINKSLHPGVTWSPPEPEQGPPRTVRDTIAGLPEPQLNGKGLDPESFDVHPNHWCMVPRSKKFQRADALKEGQAYGRSFRTLAWDSPSWAVAYGHREVHCHPDGKRRLSIHEAMLLQTFPGWYRLTGNISSQVRLVSEAVPPRLAWHLAVAIRNSLRI